MNTQVKSWSTQQNAFFDYAVNGQGSAILEAVAGAGKTTSILEACKRILKQDPSTRIAIMAYNKKIADEVKEKVNALGLRNVFAGTVHSFGMQAIRQFHGGVKWLPKVEARKVGQIVEKVVPADFGYETPIIKMVSFAKQRALGIRGLVGDHAAWMSIINHFDIFADATGEDRIPYDQIIDYAIKVLQQSNEDLKVVDFDDMVYLPVLHKLPSYTYDFVFVDEAQDTNPARRELAGKLLKPAGRMFAVGDRHQAIYGFTGADADSLDQIGKAYGAKYLPLTTTYRCPKSVVKFAQQWVDHIQAGDTAPEGTVSSIQIEDFFSRSDLNGEAAVLCRNTKPLVSLAFSLIRAKIACKVEGRDIGNNLIQLARKWKIQTINKLEERLDSYLAKQTENLTKKAKHTLLQTIEDQVETLRVIIDQCKLAKEYSIDDVVNRINSIFEDNVKGILVLSTIHKSKGREWKTVFWLDRQGTCPSKYAKQEWEREQEVNLQYVAATRAMSELIDVVGQISGPVKGVPKVKEVAKEEVKPVEKKKRGRPRKVAAAE